MADEQGEPRRSANPHLRDLVDGRAYPPTNGAHDNVAAFSAAVRKIGRPENEVTAAQIAALRAQLPTASRDRQAPPPPRKATGPGGQGSTGK